MIRASKVIFSGADLLAFRKKLKMSQKEFAEYIGLGAVSGQRSVSYWEQGDRSPPGPMQRALKLLSDYGPPENLQQARDKLSALVKSNQADDWRHAVQDALTLLGGAGE